MLLGAQNTIMGLFKLGKIGQNSWKKLKITPNGPKWLQMALNVS